ncbi:MAG: flagellar basal body rod protein FlgB [Chloroflexota bacterium]|nr:flagellar basal body rod protein FlgB [Chloroflexota bacterium]
MNNDLFNDTTMQGLQYALNSLSLRQQVLANNIANAQTPGYVSQDVSFEDRLGAILSGSDTSATPNSTGTVIATPDMTTSPNGNTVSMESEMSKTSETGIMYDALTQLTADRMGVLKTAIG